jgi:hypothetical protein
MLKNTPLGSALQIQALANKQTSRKFLKTRKLKVVLERELALLTQMIFFSLFEITCKTMIVWHGIDQKLPITRNLNDSPTGNIGVITLQRKWHYFIPELPPFRGSNDQHGYLMALHMRVWLTSPIAH